MWWKGGCLILPIALFVLLRLPATMQQPGMQDEQYFAVPGWTVWQRGVPQIPYFPTRNRASFFEGADRCLMALPPAQFYAQAPFFGLFAPGYFPARMPSFVGALALIILFYRMALMIGANHWAALLVTIYLAISRPLLFTATHSRPDLLCTLCGIASLFIWWRWYETDRGDQRPWHLYVTGALCGLGALFHPFALVYFLMVFVGIACVSGSVWQRLCRLIQLTLPTTLVFSLWLPLILKYPDEFKSQFTSNVLERSGPRLHMRLLWPFESLQHQAGNFLELCGPWQGAFYLSVLLILGWIAYAWKEHGKTRLLLVLTTVSVYLTASIAGVHPTLGYWLLPVVLICLGWSHVITLAWMHWPRWRVYALSGAIGLLMLPGAGLTASWKYLRYYGSPEYDARRFIAQVLDEVPRDGKFIVDLSYVVDVYFSGRETRLYGNKDLFWGDTVDDYDYLLVAWHGIDTKAAEQYGAEPVKTYGQPGKLPACYVYFLERSDRK